jgi:hypothetical protein
MPACRFMPTASQVPVPLSLSIRYSLCSITCRIQNYMLYIMLCHSFNTFQVLLDGELEQLGHLLLLLLAHFRLALAQPSQVAGGCYMFRNPAPLPSHSYKERRSHERLDFFALFSIIQLPLVTQPGNHDTFLVMCHNLVSMTQ